MSGSEEKSFAPSVRKLRDARRRGEFARSKDVINAAVTAAGFATLLLLAPGTVSRFAGILDRMGTSAAISVEDAVRTTLVELAWAGLGLLAPLLALLAAAAVATSVIAHGGLTISATPVVPKLERLDPVKGLGRLFKLRGLIELLKGLAKLAVVTAIATIVLRRELGILAEVPSCGTACVSGIMWDALYRLLAACCVAFLLLGLFDIGLQRWLFRRDMRMTRTEHKRDRRDSEGDPELRAQRRKERRETAQLGARTGLRHATFVVHSPAGALAFRYAPPNASVPVLVARAGPDAASALLVEARRRGVPAVFDTDAVQALRPGLEVGRMVPRAAFGAVIRCMTAAGVIGR